MKAIKGRSIKLLLYLIFTVSENGKKEVSGFYWSEIIQHLDLKVFGPGMPKTCLDDVMSRLYALVELRTLRISHPTMFDACSSETTPFYRKLSENQNPS